MNVFNSSEIFVVNAVRKKLRQQAKHLSLDHVGGEWQGQELLSLYSALLIFTMTLCPYHSR